MEKRPNRKQSEELAASRPERRPERDVPTDINQLQQELRIARSELALQAEQLARTQEKLAAYQGQNLGSGYRPQVGPAVLFNLIENSGALVFIKDTQGRYLMVNRKWMEVTGMSREKVLGNTDAELFPGEEGRQFRANDLEAMAAKKVLEREETLGAGAEKRFFISIKFPLLNAQGRVDGVCGMTTEITERKQTEEALAREKSFVDAFFDAIPGLLYVYDAEGRLLRWNRKHEIMTGYSAEELAGMHLMDWYKGDEASQQAVREGVETTLRTGYGEAEAMLQCKDGTVIPMYFTASLLTLGGQQYFTGIGLDVSERKKAAQESEKLQNQLIQAQRMESVGRLAGGVAHDFNNMLGVILGQTELTMQSMDAGDPLLPRLREIHTAASRSADLTRQLLAFARKQTITPRVLDLNETVEGMLTMLRRLIGEDIDLAWHPKTDLWAVKVDPSQIDQILANLCINARDAIAGSGRVTIETGCVVFDEDYCRDHPGSQLGQYVLLAVGDDGCGMCRETMEKLFEPFFTTKETGKGTGLGMAMVYGIVKQNHGFIDVDSAPGQGTIFRVYFPRELDGTKTVREGSNPEAELVGGSERVLLVEDEPAILGMAQAMLEHLGYSVVSASTPSEALQVADRQIGRIDLLMTDVIMPVMNGPELAKRLRLLNPHMETLFMSGYTANVIAHHNVLDAGVHFIQKPFSIADLAVKLREALP